MTPGRQWVTGEPSSAPGGYLAAQRAAFILQVTGSSRPQSAMASIVQARLSVDVHRDDRAAIVAPSGEVDLASAPSLEAALGRAWQSGAEHVILDLRGVQFMDSTGLHVILSAHQHAKQIGLRFEIVDGGEQVHKLLTLTGVLNKLNVAAEPAELLHSSPRI